jgi:glycosyltransferase involved in cell wall biosynthesis
MDVSIVIPAYNEARRLPTTLAAWQTYFAPQPFAAEVLVVDDGSTDTTAATARAAGANVESLQPNQGKGGAVRAGVVRAQGDVIAYADADLNIDPSHLTPALRFIQDGADLVVGTRDLSEYAKAEGVLRLIAGGLVQVTRRTLVLPTIRDTQCGFKVFRRDLAHRIFTMARVSSFAFDIEALFLARKLGARIVQMPVSTSYRAESTFNVRKHLPIFLRDIVKIRLDDLAGRYSYGEGRRRHE